MKIVISIALASFTLLAACATVETSTQSGSAKSSDASTMYCWKSRLQTSGDNYSCNWADSTKVACDQSGRTNVSKSAVVGEPTDANRCENGQWLVRVSKK